jgi:hypothetical protein
MPSSNEIMLRLEDRLEEEPDERERLEVCETWKRQSKLEMLCFVVWITYVVVIIESDFCHLL